MNTKNYNMATHYFREMEKENPNVPQWGAFADAMDEVISTCVPVVRCVDCTHYNKPHSGCCENEIPHGYAETWFCADGERKSADEILMEEMDADPLG